MRGDFVRDNIKGRALTEVTFFILLSLYKPKHGYAIMQFIENETHGRLILGAGSLYGAINSLLAKKWIEPYGTNTTRKKEYVITSLGKKITRQEIKRIDEILKIADRIVEEE